MRYFILIFLLLPSFYSPSQAQDMCVAVGSACQEVDSNLACYAGGNIDIIQRTNTGDFLQEGDTIDLSDIDRMTFTNGSAVFQLNDTLKLTVYGNVSLENQTQPPANVSAVLTANGRIRIVPELGDNPALIITAVNSGEALELLGRTEAGDWLLVRFPEQYASQNRTIGWVSTQVLSIQGDRMALPVLAHGIIQRDQTAVERLQAGGALAPMSQFMFASSADDSECATSGILVESSRRNRITINDLDINISGNAFLSMDDDTLDLAVIDGYAIVNQSEQMQLVPAGTYITSEFAPALPYEAELSDQLTALAPALTVSEPLAEDQIQAVIAETLAPHGALSGTYRFAPAQVTQYAFESTSPYGDNSGCMNTYQSTVDTRLVFEEAHMTAGRSYGATENQPAFTFPRISDTTFGHSEAQHAVYHRVPNELMSMMTFPTAESFIILSPTEVLWRMSTAYHHSTEWEGYGGIHAESYYTKLACEFRFYGQWVSE